MLKAQSDIGQTLFAAASGLVALSQVREELKQQLDEIGSLYRAREKPIWRAEQAYQTAATQTQDLALRADEWNAAEQALSAAKERLELLSRERGVLEASRAELERKLRVLPILGEIDRLREQAVTVTAAGGYYEFTGLISSTYYVSFTMPPGITPTASVTKPPKWRSESRSRETAG